jgi:hypothetical protein
MVRRVLGRAFDTTPAIIFLGRNINGKEKKKKKKWLAADWKKKR